MQHYWPWNKLIFSIWLCWVVLTHVIYRIYLQRLTHQYLGDFFNDVILFSGIYSYYCNIFVWNLFRTMHIQSALWALMPGAKAPGHQYQQCWVSTHAIPVVYGLTKTSLHPVLYKTHMNISNWPNVLLYSNIIILLPYEVIWWRSINIYVHMRHTV